jgi:putative intracellular protease/amidase
MAKIPFVMTATSCWTVKDGTRHPTGHWAEEFAAPCIALTAAAHEVVVATPGGIVPYVDAMSLRPQWRVAFWRLPGHRAYQRRGGRRRVARESSVDCRRRTNQVGGRRF